MEKLKLIPTSLYLLGYILAAALFTALIFLLHIPPAVQALLIVPVAAAAALYASRFYLWPMTVATACGLVTVWRLSDQPQASLQTLAALLVMSVLLCEFIYRLATAQARLQAEIGSLARLPAESPNPVLRLAPDGRILYRNPAAVEMLRTWSPTGGDEMPERWRALVEKVLRTGARSEIEECSGGKCYACLFAPTSDLSYVNVYATEITERTRATAALEQQREYLTALHETTLGLMNRLDPTDLLQAIVSRATQLMHGDFGWLYLVNPKDDLLEVRFATEGFRDYLGQGLRRGEGLAGVIWQTGQPQAVDDYSRWPHRSSRFPVQMVRAAVGVPLISGNQTLGVLGISLTGSDRTFSEAEIGLLGRFAQLAAIALDNAQLFVATHRQAQELTLLHQVRTALAREVDLPDLIKTVVEATARTFDYDLVSLYLLRDGALHLQHQVGYNQVLTVIPISQGVTGRVARTGAPILLEDVRADPVFLEAIPGITSEVCVPLFDQSQVVGVLNVETLGALHLSEADLRILTALGEHVSIALGRVRLYAQARENEQRFRRERDFAHQVMNAMGQGLTVTGPDGHFEYVNPAYAAMLGYPPEALIGQTPEEFTAPEEIAGLTAAWERRLIGETTSYETRLCRADGGIVHALITGSPRWYEGRVIGSIAVITDLTERQQMEAALAQARDQALEASRLKSEFLATMSHEIRTPMSSVIGMNDLLLDTPLSEDQREYAETVRDSAQSLLVILDDILDFSKIEAGKLSLDLVNFEPVAVVGNAVDLFALRARERGLSLTATLAPDVPARLCGDPVRLRQVLVNLIGNAVKFTERGGVTVAVDREIGSLGTGSLGVAVSPNLPIYQSTDLPTYQLRFTVSDTGIGLSDTARRRLFQPFTQADGSTTRRFGGTGLGLAICKRLVELMGGEIGVESEVGHGSRFWFTAQFRAATAMAVAVEPAPAATSGSEPLAAGPHGHILLAEDNPVNRRLTILHLEKLGYVVATATNGCEAVAAVTGSPDRYDLILMDCQMPEMDGFSAARAIRQAEAGSGRRIPIIAMTAHAMQGDRDACLAAGMDDYVSKPVRWPELHGLLARWITGSADEVGPVGNRPYTPAATVLSTLSATDPITISQPGAPADRATAPPAAAGSDHPLDADILASLRELEVESGPGVLGELFDSFLKNSSDRMNGLRAALTAGDAATLHRVAHSVKGSSGNFGALRLSALFARLEQAAANGSLDEASGLMAQIEAEYALVKAALAVER